jgi:hypothetical protein
MEFRVDCACGLPIKVTEAAADGSVRCLCGRDVPVPPLTELRERAGLPPYNIAPEVLVEHLLAAGELPPDDRCVECGTPTDGVVPVRVECERTFVRQSGGFSWKELLLFWLLPISIFFLQRREVREYGRDKIYRLPLPVCGGCRGRLSGRTVRERLSAVPVYEQLLDKFPDAKVTLESW